MTFSFTTGILDNDPKGETGIGTIFYMDINLGGHITRHTWGLLEELSGKVRPRDWVQPYIDAQNKIRAELEAQAAVQKEAAMKAREDSVVEDPAVVAIIKDVIAAETKTVEQYKSGKEKALNALVGKVIGQIKQRNLSYADGAFGISKLLVKHIV